MSDASAAGVRPDGGRRGARVLVSVAFASVCAPGWAHTLAHASTAPAQMPSVFHAPLVTAERGTARTPRMPFYVATKGATTIYLLGTLHVGDPADYPSNRLFRRPILDALAASPALALELSPDDLLESQDDVSKYGVCDTPCLPRLLPSSLWRQLAARLSGNPAALAEIRKMRPWLAALVVETYDSLLAGLQTEYGTEAQLQNVFLRKHGAKVVGLETLAEQMQAFTGLTLPEQREMLAQNIRQTPARNAGDVKALHRLWQAGDADAVAAWSAAKSARLARSKTIAVAADNKIIYERNQRFTLRIVLLSTSNNPLFVAIGALHLGGPRGVLKLLEQQGYDVETQ